MTDFYKELNLDNSKSIAELNIELSQLESTWKRREITNPEKATTMLALIIQARKVFASESARREYDRELAKSKEKPAERDPNAEREKQFKKWYGDARSYYDGKQYDLAKTAVEKALSYYDQASDNDAFLSLAAKVYNRNQHYSAALDYINKAIIISPEDAMHYISKAYIYGEMAYSRQRYNNLSEIQLIQNARDTLNQAIAIAHYHGDKNAESAAYGLLAYYHHFVFSPDRDKAEEYANKSVALGDVFGYAGRVLKDIKLKRQQEEKAAEEQKRRDEEQRRLQEQRIRLQKQEEARQIRLQKQEEARRAEQEKQRRQQEQRAKEERERIERQEKTIFELYKVCWLGFFAWVALMFYRLFFTLITADDISLLTFVYVVIVGIWLLFEKISFAYSYAPFFISGGVYIGFFFFGALDILASQWHGYNAVWKFFARRLLLFAAVSVVAILVGLAIRKKGNLFQKKQIYY